MERQLSCLQIVTSSDALSPLVGEVSSEFHQEKIRQILEVIFPYCFYNQEDTLSQLQEVFQTLPIAISSPPAKLPGTISFYALSKSHPDVFKCFYNWINNYLIPERQLHIVHLYSTDFQLIDIDLTSYTICEISVKVEEAQELGIMQRRFPLIKNQKELGIASYSQSKRLDHDLGLAIDHVMYPVFMPSNEEEIMRNILSLSNQLKYVRDIPQIMITFDRQTRNSLLFTVVLVRVLHADSVKIQDMFRNANTVLEYIHDRTKNIGLLRKKYIKEAVVFHVKIPKESFLRIDHSLDLFKARQAVVKELNHVIGDLRDFNGGMISQQTEILSALVTLLAESGDYPEFLIENFFYSLTPSIMRYLIEPEALKTLFLMLLQVEESELTGIAACSIHTQQDKHYTFAAVLIRDFSVKERISHYISELNISSTSLVSATMHLDQLPCLGFIYQCDDTTKQKLFCDAIRKGCSSDTFMNSD